MNEYMKETNEALLHTYNQFPVVLEKVLICMIQKEKNIWTLRPDMQCLRWDMLIKN